MEKFADELGRQMMENLMDIQLDEEDARWVASLHLEKGLLHDYTEEEIHELKIKTERYLGYGNEG